MGKMQLNITPEISGTVDDKITINSYVDSVCSTSFVVSINLTSSAYIQWAPSSSVVISGGGVDEALAIGLHTFTVSIPGFSGFAVDQFTQTTLVAMELKTSEFGLALDSRLISRSHTNQLC